MTTAYVYYRDIPKRPRALLDEIYHPRGAELWWNGRHGWLANLRPREEWKTDEGRERVLQILNRLADGNF